MSTPITTFGGFCKEILTELKARLEEKPTHTRWLDPESDLYKEVSRQVDDYFDKHPQL